MRGRIRPLYAVFREDGYRMVRGEGTCDRHESACHDLAAWHRDGANRSRVADRDIRVAQRVRCSVGLLFRCLSRDHTHLSRTTWGGSLGPGSGLATSATRVDPDVASFVRLGIFQRGLRRVLELRAQGVDRRRLCAAGGCRDNQHCQLADDFLWSDVWTNR